MFESWQSPRLQTKDRPPVTSRGRQASVSSLPEDAGLGSQRRGFMCSGLGEAKLSRVHVTPTHHGLHQDDLDQDDLVKKGQGLGSLFPQESQRSVVGKSLLPEKLPDPAFTLLSRRQHTSNVVSALHEP